MENQNILRIVLSLAIVVAFFLPLSNVPVYGDDYKAWSLLVDSLQNSGSLSAFSATQLFTIICLLVVFVCVVVNLLLAIARKRTSVLFNLLPLFAIIAIIVFTMARAKAGSNVAETLQSFSTGFFIMFIGSFLLPFTSIAVPTAASNQ